MRFIGLLALVASGPLGCAKRATPPPEIVEIEPDTEPVVEAPPRVCWDAPTDPDRRRFVVVSHPFAGPGINGETYELLSLYPDGTLAEMGTTFKMRRATDGSIAFSPDGRLGIATQTDGTLGVFTLTDTGLVTVIYTAFGDDDFYAREAVIDTDEGVVWVVDGNWPNNGGGLYRVPLDCVTGELGTPIRVMPSKLAVTLMQRKNADDLLVATSIGDSDTIDDAHLVNMETFVASASGPVLDDLAIRSGAALVADEWLIVGDNSAFSGIPQRVAISHLTNGDIVPHATFEMSDPYDVAASPFGNAALVTSGIRNAVWLLSLEDGEWSLGSIIARAQLPGAMVTIDRGTLTGMVLLAENLGVRQLHFLGSGEAIEGAFLDLGRDETDVVGTIGVTP